MELASADFPELEVAIRPLYAPTEALAVNALPRGAARLFEPRWDEFRWARRAA
jgi:hypothetical protein